MPLFVFNITMSSHQWQSSPLSSYSYIIHYINNYQTLWLTSPVFFIINYRFLHVPIDYFSHYGYDNIWSYSVSNMLQMEKSITLPRHRLLILLRGSKVVELFPPSQTPRLGAYEVTDPLRAHHSKVTRRSVNVYGGCRTSWWNDR
jgi:hypothetical protein